MHHVGKAQGSLLALLPTRARQTWSAASEAFDGNRSLISHASLMERVGVVSLVVAAIASACAELAKAAASDPRSGGPPCIGRLCQTGS